MSFPPFFTFSIFTLQSRLAGNRYLQSCLELSVIENKQAIVRFAKDHAGQKRRRIGFCYLGVQL